jgi:hypothetical protein
LVRARKGIDSNRAAVRRLACLAGSCGCHSMPTIVSTSRGRPQTWLCLAVPVNTVSMSSVGIVAAVIATHEPLGPVPCERWQMLRVARWMCPDSWHLVCVGCSCHFTLHVLHVGQSRRYTWRAEATPTLVLALFTAPACAAWEALKTKQRPTAGLRVGERAAGAFPRMCPQSPPPSQALNPLLLLLLHAQSAAAPCAAWCPLERAARPQSSPATAQPGPCTKAERRFWTVGLN